MELEKRHCIPCEGGVKPLDKETARNFLREVHSRWNLSVDGDRIARTFNFKDFKEAMVFVNAVSDLAESEGHHPDIRISYARVTLELTTHAIHGLSENDFILAKKIDPIAARRTK